MLLTTALFGLSQQRSHFHQDTGGWGLGVATYSSGENATSYFYLFAFPLASSSQTFHPGFVISGSEAGVGDQQQSLVVKSTGSRMRQIWLLTWRHYLTTLGLSSFVCKWG